MKKTDCEHYQVEQIKKFLQSQKDEIFSLDELREQFDFQIVQKRDVSKFRTYIDNDWICKDTVKGIYYYGCPEAVKEFVEDVPNLEAL
jgi:hypothetical protein